MDWEDEAVGIDKVKSQIETLRACEVYLESRRKDQLLRRIQWNKL